MIGTVLDGPSRLRLQVRVQPRASRNRIAGRYGDALKVQLTAPPVEGAANAALVELLADAFDVRRSDVRIVSGERGRTKVVDIVAGDPEGLRWRLEALVPIAP